MGSLQILLCFSTEGLCGYQSVKIHQFRVPFFLNLSKKHYFCGGPIWCWPHLSATKGIVAIFYPFSQFCGIGVSLLSLQKQPNTAPNLFQRGVEYGKYESCVEKLGNPRKVRKHGPLWRLRKSCPSVFRVPPGRFGRILILNGFPTRGSPGRTPFKENSAAAVFIETNWKCLIRRPPLRKPPLGSSWEIGSEVHN